ncbi:DUF6660 family protein [Nonlabens antarcticus]|uniref:DUF6660 family protein n=1 Tax=Nonlabens antarcticus TaxID=392714 RepID=UPI001E497281|nr:DUF6660 family protein [Nonlabens antarcticus]
MVRYLAIILSVYFLSLGFAPCQDAIVDSQVTSLEVTQNATVDHDHAAVDLCTPFCQCHCCHVHTLDVGIVAFEPVKSDLMQKGFFHFDSIGKDISHSLLQPPRV